MLLVIVFVLSSFLDNIAAALIGGTMARHVFRGKVHIGYLAAIVAASNAGGSGSVVGDTTTTMMWIDGVSPLSVLEAYVAAVVALVIFGIPAAIAAAPLLADRARTRRAACRSTGCASCIVAVILVAAILANVIANLRFPALLGHDPGDRARRVGRDPARPRRCAGPTGRSCRRPSRARSSCSRW